MIDTQMKYAIQNREQQISEEDPFTVERYEQFYQFFPQNISTVLDVGCNTGRGGKRLKELNPSLKISGLDCVQERLHSLPNCYSDQICGLSTEIPINDCHFDVVVAGEFLEHLYPIDVDKTLCEFQRVLKIGGRLMMTTPNPNYIKTKLKNETIYGIGHLSQHYPEVLRLRLLMHGFSNVKVYGSGKVSRYIGYSFPIRAVYGSYLIVGDKY